MRQTVAALVGEQAGRGLSAPGQEHLEAVTAKRLVERGAEAKRRSGGGRGDGTRPVLMGHGARAEALRLRAASATTDASPRESLPVGSECSARRAAGALSPGKRLCQVPQASRGAGSAGRLRVTSARGFCRCARAAWRATGRPDSAMRCCWWKLWHWTATPYCGTVVAWAKCSRSGTCWNSGFSCRCLYIVRDGLEAASCTASGALAQLTVWSLWDGTSIVPGHACSSAHGGSNNGSVSSSAIST